MMDANLLVRKGKFVYGCASCDQTKVSFYSSHGFKPYHHNAKQSLIWEQKIST